MGYVSGDILLNLSFSLDFKIEYIKIFKAKSRKFRMKNDVSSSVISHCEKMRIPFDCCCLIFIVPYHVVGKLETAAEDFQVRSYFDFYYPRFLYA